MLKEWIEKFKNWLKFLNAADETVYTVREGKLTKAAPGIVNAVIPFNVKEVRINAFKDSKETLESVEFSGSVFRTFHAFERYPNLSKIVFGKGMREITDFDGCKISQVTFPEGLEDLYGFNRCYELKSVTVPGSVKRLGGFCDCTSLEQVTLCDGVQTIAWAFQGCVKLESVVIPESVIAIGEGSFSKTKRFYYKGTKERWERITESFTLPEGATVEFEYDGE